MSVTVELNEDMITVRSFQDSITIHELQAHDLCAQIAQCLSNNPLHMFKKVEVPALFGQTFTMREARKAHDLIIKAWEEYDRSLHCRMVEERIMKNFARQEEINEVLEYLEANGTQKEIDAFLEYVHVNG